MKEELEPKNEELNKLVKELKVKDEKLAVIEESVTAEIAAPASVSGNGALGWPTKGGYISSYMEQRWGKMHKGIDIARTDGVQVHRFMLRKAERSKLRHLTMADMEI